MRLASSALLRRSAAMSSSSSSYGVRLPPHSSPLLSSTPRPFNLSSRLNPLPLQRRGYPRPRRGYAASPSPPPGAPPDAGAELVSGDSHLSAVRAANESLRRGGGGVRGPPSPYRHGPQPHQPHYGYGHGYGYGYGRPQHPAPPYGAVPYNYGRPQHQQLPPGPQYGYGPQQQPLPPGPQYGYGAPNPYVHVHPQQQPPWRAPPGAGFRPGAPQLTPRLAEYRRRWRFAKQRPPHQAERFKVLSYNILADYLAQEHQFLYERIPSFILDWNWRKDKLVFEFGLWSPDILCLQEVDKFTDLEQEMASRGYNGIWKMRTGNTADGCAIFWRTTRFQLRYEEDIEFNKLGLRDNVAQVCVLESVVPQNVQTDTANLSTSSSHPHQAKQVVVCNIHVLYNPKRGDIKLGQVRTLLDRAYAVSKMWNDAPVILCGDFNSTPKSPLYDFVLEQKLNLSGLAKNTISGQQTSGSSQGLYTGPNISRSHPPFYPTNSREANITLLNDRKPQTETTNLVENSCPAGRELVTDTSSESLFDSKSSNNCGNNIPCSGSSNPDEQGLLNCLEGPVKDACASDADEECTSIDKPDEGCFGGIKTESGEGPDSTDVPSAPATVLSSDNLPGDVISKEFTCTFDANGVQSDQLLSASKDKPNEKENAFESMLSAQKNCATDEPESSHINGSQNVTDTLHQMSNVRLEGENSTGPAELVHQLNGAVSEACVNQCSAEVINKNSVSCGDESENNAHAFEDDIKIDEVTGSDVNSDPSFFEELSGVNDHLLEEDGQLPVTSDSSPSSQQMVSSNEGYYYYDPYRWTPEEIKAATGNDECTSVEHSLKLRSVYTDVDDFEGTKDANKEPLVTSYNRKFMGTVDYIWASEDLQTVQVLDTFPKEILKQTIGFPTKKWGSDHIALACELAFTK
ncbi:Carbon catabolite repressor protein 4-like protein 6 [Dichanthelium oligosanthes]|uniref:Carbon catabolite repressor protein 4-like protein 6 n=1 Tax=Dichanthelium oligosanthes TaxID=888268 RepID=A0A1E5VRH8_9POAL|nr:Carbon catabolite repressor protein 4-like protein 6 [Dichanthelium oligosanthes]